LIVDSIWLAGIDSGGDALKREMLVPALAIASALALGGCAAAKHAPDASAATKAAHTNVSEPSASPTPTPTLASTTPAIYNYGLTEADVAYLEAKDVYGLNTTPTDEKIKLAMYYAQSLTDFAKGWQSISKNPLDQLPAVVSGDNTPQEIVEITWMMHRQAMTLKKPDYTFDKAAAEKYLVAQLRNGTLSQLYPPLDAAAASQDGGVAPSNRTLAATNELPMPTINSSSAKYKDLGGRTCIDMNLTRTLAFSLAHMPYVTGDTMFCLATNDKGSLWMER
jgi:hypothetical protein